MNRLRQTLLFFICSAALCCLALRAPAQRQQQNPPAKQDQAEDLINADRPGIADGSTVIGPSRFQFETGLQKGFGRAGTVDTRALFVPTLLRFGINSQWEARVETNGYTRVTTSDPAAGVSITDGYSPISLGVKDNFQPPDDKHPFKPSLGAIFRVFVPSGSSDFHSNRFTGDLRLVADINLTNNDNVGNWELNPNVGVAYGEDPNVETFTSLLAACTLNWVDKTKHFNPFVDFGLQGPEMRRGKTAVIIDAGAAYILGQNWQLDASVGTGILGSTTPHPFWSVGISGRFR